MFSPFCPSKQEEEKRQVGKQPSGCLGCWEEDVIGRKMLSGSSGAGWGRELPSAGLKCHFWSRVALKNKYRFW